MTPGSLQETRVYDHVIVGAGSAGCVLARRLARESRVLLLEAGGSDRRLNITLPAAFPRLVGSAVDWAFETTEQGALGGRRIPLPRGRVVGGSSSINAMIHTRGHPSEYDAWARQGGDHWRYSALEPLFEALESESGPPAGAGLALAHVADPNPLTGAFLDAAEDLGVMRRDGPDAGDVDQAGLCRVTQHRGRRWSVARGYLRGAPRSLSVRRGARVTRVMLESDRAVGVAYRRGNSLETARAERGVILCAGAFQSPQLLMLSGIGPGTHLQPLGIQVLHELPAVGENLQDHLMVVSLVNCREPVTLLSAGTLGDLFRFLVRGRGPLTSCVAEAIAFLRSRAELPAPDLELLFAPVQYDLLAPPQRHAFGIAAALLRPRSRGRVRLRSADPMSAPVIDPAFLSHPDDLPVLMEGVEAAQRWLEHPAFDRWRGEPLVPQAPPDSPAALEAFVRERAETVYHPAGTCAMGPDGVVDGHLRVHGLKGLRVVDASVMPHLIGAHPNAAVVVLAEQAARLIIQEDR